MIQMPVFCSNCNIFFDLGYLFGGAGTVVMSGSKANCPKCGKMNPIPDGVYEFINTSIDFINGLDLTLDRLTKIRQTLIDIKENNTDIANAQKQINTDLPELNSISSTLPKTKIELYTFIGLLVTIIGLVISSFSGGKQQPVEYNTFINNYSYSVDKPKQIPDSDSIKIKIQRNDPCQCGSGKKFKNCHGKH